jgi:hypothetical protein
MVDESGVTVAKRTRNKTDLDVSIQNLLAGVQRHVGKNAIQLLGKLWTGADLERVLTKNLTDLRATEAMYKHWQLAVRSYHTTYELELLPLILALRAHLEAAYGPRSEELTHFGFKHRRPRTQTTESKKAAVRKARATRKARKTMGRRQKQQIRGEVASESTEPVPSLTTPSSTRDE